MPKKINNKAVVPPESDVLKLAKDFIARQSITPEDAGCQDVIIQRLKKLGFIIEPMIFADTTNLWARHGATSPVFVFAGHTDVVPAGDLAQWQTPPFSPTVQDGYLYGRGAADMKGSLAAMIIAAERFITQYPDHQGSLAFLITSDEEGPFINGTTRVVDTLINRNEMIDMCLVGEPSSNAIVGDIVKNGRRGSLTGDLTIFGIQGHVAYPHLAQNPLHQALPALAQLAAKQWDMGNEFFPPTSFQIANLHTGTGASNVIPGVCQVQFNFRFSTELSVAQIKAQVHSILDAQGLNYKLDWLVNGEPFLTKEGALLAAVNKAITQINQQPPKLETTGGTSDGRFIAKTGAQVVELGPVNATIHKVNESVKVADLEILTDMYQKILENILL